MNVQANCNSEAISVIHGLLKILEQVKRWLIFNTFIPFSFSLLLFLNHHHLHHHLLLLILHHRSLSSITLKLTSTIISHLFIYPLIHLIAYFIHFSLSHKKKANSKCAQLTDISTAIPKIVAALMMHIYLQYF